MPKVLMDGMTLMSSASFVPREDRRLRSGSGPNGSWVTLSQAGIKYENLVFFSFGYATAFSFFFFFNLRNIAPLLEGMSGLYMVLEFCN